MGEKIATRLGSECCTVAKMVKKAILVDGISLHERIALCQQKRDQIWKVMEISGSLSRWGISESGGT